MQDSRQDPHLYLQKVDGIPRANGHLLSYRTPVQDPQAPELRLVGRVSGS